MFARLFGNKTRDITNPVHKIWVKWFTMDPPKFASLQEKFPEVAQILSSIPDECYTKVQIHQDRDIDDNNYFVGLFKLAEPINPNMKNLLSLINTSTAPVYHTDKFTSMVISTVYHHLIRFLYQFEGIYIKGLSKDAEALELLKETYPLLNFLYTIPLNYSIDALYLLQEFYKFLSKELREEKIILSFFEETIKQTIEYITKVEKNIIEMVPMFEFLVQYYQHCVRKYHTPQFSKVDLTDCITILDSLLKIQPEFAILHKSSILDEVMNTGFNMLSFFFLRTKHNLEDDDIFLLGVSFLKLMKYVVQLDDYFADYIWHHQMLHFVVAFATWCVDHFPFTEFPADHEENNQEEVELLKAPQIEPPIMEFVDLLAAPFELSVIPSTISDSNQILQYTMQGQNEELMSVKHIKEIMKELISLSRIHGSQPFVEVIIDSSLAYVAKFITNDMRMFEAKSDCRQLAASLMMFLIQFLMQPDNFQMVSNAMIAQRGFKRMVDLFLFKPEGNTWSNDMMRQDNRIFYEARTKIFVLFASCYQNVEKSRTPILQALSRLFSSSPIIIDEVIKFIVILFRTSINDFISNVINTNLIPAIIGYMVEMQAIHQKMIADKWDDSKISLMEQSRMHIYHFFDFILCMASPRSFVFTYPEFDRALIHFLFEKNVQLFALQLLENGLRIDEGIFGSDSSNPFDPLFPIQKALMRESLKHVNDDKWIALMIKILMTFQNSFPLNRKTLLPWIEKYGLLEDISELPKISTEEETIIEIVNDVLQVFYILVQNTPPLRKRLSKSPMKNITEALQGRNFGDSTVNGLMQLIFERTVDLKHLPRNADIHNSKVLPYIHEATKHLAYHDTIFRYICNICIPSITNKLKVFQSKMPIVIIQYIQSFKTFPAAKSDGSYAPSVNDLLILFCTVSSTVFKWKTFFEAIRCMRPVDGKRSWWTVQLISNFANILSEINQKPPSSFFHFDGRHSGIDLPMIPEKTLSNGFTFMIRFELGTKWNVEGRNARLLSLTAVNGNRLELYFEEKKLIFEYKRGRDAPQRIVISRLLKKTNKSTPFEFEPNQWYRLIFMISSEGQGSVNINGNKIHVFNIKSFKFDHAVKSGAVACASSASGKAISEDPLIVNISSIYMFRDYLSHEVVNALQRLPQDFCYTFAPSQKTMFPEIEQSLFSDTLNDLTVFCYNARMTAGDVCANLASNGIGNATVRGQIIPFSTTFCDVASNIGGLKTFLPILQQVDYEIENEPSNDSANFLILLIGLFNQFLASSNIIQNDFMQTDGMKALAYLLGQLKPQTVQSRTINQLCDLFWSMENDKYRLITIRDLLLNFPLWGVHTPEVQIGIFEYSWSRIFAKKPELLMKITSVGKLLMLLVNEKNKEIRAATWAFILKFAEYKFDKEDQETLFEFAFSNVETELLNEILEKMHFLMESKVHNFHRIVEQYKFYMPFIHLSAAEEESVRIYSLKFICLIYDFQLGQSLPSENPIAQFTNAIINSIVIFNKKGSTERLWNYASSLFFSNKRYQSALFPYLVHISSCYEKEVSVQFIESLVSAIAQRTEISQSISQTPMWQMWLFLLMTQANRPKTVLGEDDGINTIFAYVFAFIAQTRGDLYNDSLAFFEQLMYSMNLDAILIMRPVFLKLLQILKPQLSTSLVATVSQSIFHFLFYQYDIEMYSSNVQLMERHQIKIPNNLNATFPGNETVTDFFSKFRQKIGKASSKFSMRVTPSGEWLDIDLAKEFANLLSLIPTAEITEYRIRSVEMQTFILCQIIQIDNGYIDRAVEIVSDILKNTEPLVFQMFGNTLMYIAFRNREMVKKFADFNLHNISYVVKIPHTSTSADSAYDPEKDAKFIAEFNEYCKEGRSYFYETLAGKVQDKFTQIIQQRISDSRRSTVEFASYLNPQPETFLQSTQFIKKFTLFEREFHLQRASSEKAWKKTLRELQTNGGPWCTLGNAAHWKMSSRYDSHYRRIFMKPNLEYDLHKRASLLRDEPSFAQAEEKYQNWLDTHPEAKSIDAPEKDDSFDDDEGEQEMYSFTVDARLITAKKNFDGNFLMNNQTISFDDPNSTKSVVFPISRLDMVLHRSYMHVDTGLEFFLKTNRSYFVMFTKKQDRAKVIKMLRDRSKCPIIQTGAARDLSALQEATNSWRSGQISTFDYLMKLNFFAGRSFNDLSQYPIFPWVIKDFTSETLDLKNPEVYRDLSKPIGALNPRRLESCIANFQECPDSPEKCLYRMHYSNAFYVLHFLVRLEPFTTLHIEVNDEKFDKPNRMFTSIKRSWDAVTSNLPDYRELIPEFYCNSEFLTNHNGFDLGSDGDVVNGDVILPSWAKSPEEFISKHREALESPYVRQHIPEWIDLIFGYKQQGQAAVQANNTFHAYCYPSIATREVLADPELLATIQFTAGNVGIIPQQLFTSPHQHTEIEVFVPRFTAAVLKPTVHSEASFVCGCQNGYLVLNTSMFLSVVSGQQMTTIGSVASFIPVSKGMTQKSFAFFPEINRFVCSSPWDSSFHVFKTDQQLTHCFSERQKFALIHSMTAVGREMLLTSWRDSSISLYNASTGAQVYRVTPNVVSLVDVDASASLDLMASVDKSRTVVISRLSSGRFVRSFASIEHPQRLAFLDTGYIAIAGGEESSELCVYSNNGTEISRQKFDAKVTSWTAVESFAGQVLVVGLSSAKVVALSMPSLKVVYETLANAPPVVMSYAPTIHAILLSDCSKYVSAVSIA